MDGAGATSHALLHQCAQIVLLRYAPPKATDSRLFGHLKTSFHATASVECSGHHGAEYHHLGPPAVPTGKGFSISFVDLGARSVIKSIPLDFLAVWDEFTPDGKYNFFFGSEDAKVLVVDTVTLEVVRTIALESKPTLNGYITPDPNGKYLYASVETGLQVIDTSSLRVVETIRIGGVVGTPFLLK